MSKQNFLIERNAMADELNAFINKYKEFTKKVSPNNWRTTGTHVTRLDTICAEIQEFQEITEAEKKIDWVAESLK